MMKFCSKCGRLVPYPKRMCEECESKYAVSSSGRHDPKFVQFRNSSAWHKLRQKKLQDTHYTCEECGGIATDVHHIISLADDWNQRLNYNNLQALCDQCHRRKEISECRRQENQATGGQSKKF